MDTNRIKKAAEWFYSNVFTDEAIRPRVQPPVQKLPSPLRAARSLEGETSYSWQSREALFLKQAKLLCSYEDDYAYDMPVLRYYPTYQSLTDQELRGYFSWRTKLRRGEMQKTSLSFAFLYIYELINQVGVTDPMDGYRKLKNFQSAYSQIDPGILPYLSQWLTDYAVYYDLDPALLSDTPQAVFDKNILVLANIKEAAPQQIMGAVKALAPRWLERSKFYALYPADMDAVIVRVLQRIWEHYASRCKKAMVEQYFGAYAQFPTRLFASAVFKDQKKIRSFEYAIDEICVYRCQNGLWTIQKYALPLRPNSKLDTLIKAIDSLMRQAYGYRHPVKCELDTKWTLKIIQEEIQSLLAERKAAEVKKITINYGMLAEIRKDAAITQDKLTVDEDATEDILPESPAEQDPPPSPPTLARSSLQPSLSPNEYRLLQCLLYDRDCGWIQSEGLMLSVLADGINETLYDEFMDSVLLLEDKPELIEDYIDALKEMVHP